tara:strand:+ start:49 stop:786 length:738 start_codon:yes stop_codon:yes gene_type:complete
MILIRSTLFNILFFLFTAIACIVCIPFAFSSHKTILKIVHAYLKGIYALEKNILNLDYEVRGIEHLPTDGAFLVAAKHQSTYETFKLHFLFSDPAIILKKELLSIPIWGAFLKRIEPVAINRSDRKEATEKVIEGAHRVQEQGRPLIIFPQGTRVKLEHTISEKPYKQGIARMQKATGMPIIPLALNTAKYWPRSKWCKHPGIVVFEFLPPIQPGKDIKDVMNELETNIEHHSIRLCDEAEAARA